MIQLTGCGYVLHASSSASALPTVRVLYVNFSGKYLYLNGSGKEVGAFGHIISTGYSRNSANEPRCLHFWYHLKAQNHMTLDVYAGEDNDAQNIYGMRGWNSDRWYLVKRSVPDGLLDFKLHFVGTISASVAADGGIALDDITVTPDNCQQIGEQRLRQCLGMSCLQKRIACVI